MSHELQATHWIVPEDSVSWNPTYLMSRVAETLAREGRSYDFIGALTCKIIGVGTHTKLDQCVGYNVEIFYYDNTWRALLPVRDPIDWDGSLGEDFNPMEFLNAFTVDGWLRDGHVLDRQFIAYAFEKSVYFRKDGT